MKKRILSLLLAVVMIVGMLPTVALAAETGDNAPTNVSKPVVVHEEEDDPIHIKKSVSDDGSMLTLEAYVTNPLKIVTDAVPLDIALVLDVSGSMDNEIGTEKYEEVYDLKTTGKNNRYYYLDENGSYVRAYYCDGQHKKGTGHEAGWFASEKDHSAENRLTPKTSAEDTTGMQFYKYAGSDKTSKIDVLKTAVNKFIENVAKNSPDSSIALVKFAGNTKNGTGNDKYDESWYEVNYTQIVQPLTQVNSDTNVNALKTAVTNLDPDGMTRTDLGMDKAEEALKDAKNQKVVIVFTDGVPTYKSDYSKEVAAKAVNKAKTLKENKTLIYTIAVAKNANPTDVNGKSSEINKFLHAVSSNYPGAYANEYNNIALGDRAPSSNYYRVATTGDELIDIFQQLSKEVSTLTLKMDATTTLSDTLSGYFTFADTTSAHNGIKVYTAKAKGTKTELDWGDPVEVQNPQIRFNAEKTITVHGFSYETNAVTISPEGNVTGGAKLIVTIPITPDTAYKGWEADTKYYPTNSIAEGSKTGLSNYEDENGHELTTELNESPNAPVTAYKVTYTSTVTGTTETKPVADPEDPRTKDNKGYITGQTVTVADELSATGWTFTGWTNDDLDVTTGADGKKTFVMGNADVAFTGVWTKNPTTAHVTINKTFESADAPNGFGLSLKKADNTEVPLEKAENSFTYTAELGAGEYTLTESGEAIENMKHTAKLTKGTGTDAVEVPDKNGVWTIEITSDDIKNNNVVYNLVNTYTYYDPAEVDLSALIKKTLYGETEDLEKLNANQKTFTVKLTPGELEEGKYVWSEVANEVITGTAVCGDNGETVFFSGFKKGGITLEDDKLSLSLHLHDPSDEATWYYLVEEVVPADPSAVVVSGTNNGSSTGYTSGMKYDTRKYILAIRVSKNNIGEKFNLEDTDIYTYDEDTGTATKTQLSAINFENMYAELASGAYKEVITNDDYNYIPEDIRTKLDKADVKYPECVGEGENEKTQLIVDKSVDTITLAYAVTVRGNNLQRTFVSDDATYVGCTVEVGAATVTGNVDGQEMIFFMEDHTMVTLYYTKTFTRANGDFPGKVSNTAIVNGGDVPSEDTTITDKTPGGLDFSDIIWKDLYVTGDQNFPESLTFRANLTLADYAPFGEIIQSTPGQIAVQATPTDDSTVVDKSDTVAEAFPEDWEAKLYATFYPDGVTFDKHNTKRFTAQDGSHLFLKFPAEGQYIFRVEEINDKEDGVKYDTHVYEIVVHVWTTEDGNGLYVESYAIYDITDGEESGELLRTAETITFCNEVDTGDIPYYPIIPIIKKDDGKLNKTDHFAYIIGYPDGTVHPNGEITRAEVATIFFRLLKDDVRNAYFTSYNTYSDVQLGKWYNNPISTMSALGIINGYPDGTFRPNAPITRAEFAAIAARFDETATRGTTTFTDVYGHWAADEIAKAYDNSWIKGYPDGTFRPDRNITRAEAMALINRVLDRAPESPSDLLPDMNKWSDNMDTTKWYYLDIQEATNSHDYTRKTFNYELWKRMLLDPDWSRYER